MTDREQEVNYTVKPHPTAPAGMTRAQIRVEFAEKHGISMTKSKDMRWDELVDRLCIERRNRERGVPLPDAEEVHEEVHENPMPEVIEDEDEDDFTDLMFDDEPEPEPEPADRDDHPSMVENADISGGETDVPEPDDLDDLFSEMEQARAEETSRALFIGMPGVRDYIFDGHAGTGPSGAERWMVCTESLGLSRKFLETLSPNQQHAFAGANTAARQGTTAHAAAEVKLRHMLGEVDADEMDLTLMELAVEPLDGEEYDTTMSDHLYEYVDYVKQLVEDGYEVSVENRVRAVIPLTGSHEGEAYEVPGSADAVGVPTPECSYPNTLVVGDLKYGEGIDVSVEANPQVRIYAIGVLSDLADPETGALPEHITDVEYVIVQPRLGGIKVWTETVDELLTWRDEVLAPALTAALYGPSEGAVFAPSEETCQWCPARGMCGALAESRIAAAGDLFDEVVDAEFNGDTLDAATLSNERLGTLLLQALAITNIRDDLKAEAERRLHRGIEVPNFRLVNYTPTRKWKPGAEEELENDERVWKRTLLTPKQALTVLGDGAAVIADLIDSPDKRPVISTGPKDKRKPWEGKPPEAMFEDLDESGD